ECKKYWDSRSRCKYGLCDVTTIKKSVVSLLYSDAEKWEELLLRQCHRKCVQFAPAFPNHRGTPPALPIVLSLPSKKVNGLIPYVIEWAECDGFNRELREWIFALLLIVEKPLLPDVCAALRGLANLCKALRNSLDIERLAEFSVQLIHLLLVFFSSFASHRLPTIFSVFNGRVA
uniref:Gigantea n=1 Tax=Angiostrongylus cantonensis TaxID=6313 RepID=A0A0K0D2N7_ANGCA